MDKLKHIKVYEGNKEGFLFDELPEEIQDKIIDRESESLRNDPDMVREDDWAPDVLDEFETRMEDMGWENLEMRYSGFYSQGDGASFTGILSDGEKKTVFVKEILGMDKFPQQIIDRITFKVVGLNSRYYHENTVKLEIDDEGYDPYDYESEEIEIQSFLDLVVKVNVETMLNKFLPVASTWVKNTCIKLYDDLENAYEKYIDHISGREGIIDYFREEKTLFNSEGNEIL